MSLVTAGAFVLIVVTKRAALARSGDHLGHPHWPWIPLAVAFELASMGTFALMQRQLLGSGGRQANYRPMMATILAANALSVSVPVAGPELGAAFTFRRFKKLGADTPLASWTVLVGGLASWVGGIVVLVAGGVLSGNGLVTGLAIGAGLLAVATGAMAQAALGRPLPPPRLERAAAWVVARATHFVSRPIDDPQQAIRNWLKGLESLRLSWPEWTKVGGYGLANWLADAGVLAISILAIGAPVPWRSLLLVYGLAMVVGSLGITPGGIGLVEGTICVGLVSTGVPAALALAAVLLYRLVSFWLVAAVGWLVLLYLRLERPARALLLQGSVSA